MTVGQFRRFLDQTPDLRDRYAAFADADPDLPQTRVSWYDAVAYCNWLSDREGLPAETNGPTSPTPTANLRRECGTRGLPVQDGIPPSRRVRVGVRLPGGDDDQQIVRRLG